MKLLQNFSLLLCIVYLTGCATIINGKKQQVFINSIPAGATVKVDGKPAGITPLKIDVRRKKDAYHIELVSTGHQTRTYVAKNKYQPVWIFLNMPLSVYTLGIPHYIDYRTKATYRVREKEILVNFNELPKPVAMNRNIKLSYELVGVHNMDSLRAVEHAGFIAKRDSIREVNGKRSLLAKAYADSVKKDKIARIDAFALKNPNVITFTPHRIIFSHFELMYGRYLGPKFCVGVKGTYKFKTSFGATGDREFDTSPAFGGMPTSFINKYNAYEKIWTMPYSTGYNIGGFTRYHIFQNDGPYIQAELFGQYAAYDNVNVTWSQWNAFDQQRDSVKTSVTTGGFKLALGTTISKPLSRGVGLFVDFYLGCSAQMNHVDMFHYKFGKTVYIQPDENQPGGQEFRVLKMNEREKLSYISFIPEIGGRIGVRF